MGGCPRNAEAVVAPPITMATARITACLNVNRIVYSLARRRSSSLHANIFHCRLTARTQIFLALLQTRQYAPFPGFHGRAVFLNILFTFVGGVRQRRNRVLKLRRGIVQGVFAPPRELIFVCKQAGKEASFTRRDLLTV